MENGLKINRRICGKKIRWLHAQSVYIYLLTCLRFSFILHHVQESGGEIDEILRRHRFEPRTVAHSFIYFLTYIVIRDRASRVITLQTPLMPVHDSFSCVGKEPRELKKCAHMRTTSR